MGVNAGKRLPPAIPPRDGTDRADPTNREPARAPGLATAVPRWHCDRIVTGSIPTALAAGIPASRETVTPLKVSHQDVIWPVAGGRRAGDADDAGAGRHFRATCGGPSYDGAAAIVVVGGANAACEEALHLTRLASRSRSSFGVRRSPPAGSWPRRSCRRRLACASGSRRRRLASAGNRAETHALVIRDRGSRERATIRPAAAPLRVGQEPNSGLLSEAAPDDLGLARTGQDLLHGDAPHRRLTRRPPFGFEASVPGVFVAGDAVMAAPVR